MTAFVFVPLLAMAAIATLIVLVFAAHYFLVLVESSAHGQTTVDWPAEAFLEWFTKPARLGFLAAPWLAAAVMLTAPVAAAAKTPLPAVVLTPVLFAVLFPLGAVSAFVARSPWVPFHYRTVPLLAGKPLATLGFGLIGGGLALLGVGGGFLAVLGSQIGMAGPPVGAILAALAWFGYALMLGRLLFVVTYSILPPAPPPQDGPPPPAAAPPARPKKPRRPRRSAPVAGLEPGYGLKDDDPAPPPAGAGDPPAVPHWERPKPAWDDEDDSPYLAHPPEVEAKAALPAEVATPKESELRLIAKELGPPPPDRPWGADAWAPFGQAETMRAALTLAVLLTIYAGIVRALIELNPNR